MTRAPLRFNIGRNLLRRIMNPLAASVPMGGAEIDSRRNQRRQRRDRNSANSPAPPIHLARCEAKNRPQRDE